jgi:acetyl esterase/lipase
VPSKESDALRAHFQSMSDRMAANPQMDLVTLRGTLEELHERAAEPTGVTYEEITIDGPASELPAIWCIPVDGTDDRVILYTHGGGFVTNTRHSHRKLAGHLAKATGCRALVLEYRLAPEATFPAQLEDAVAAFAWLVEQGIAPEHIATAGDSAGGNLATAVALKLREDGRPQPAAVVGFSPWYDLEGTGSTMDTNADKDAFVQRPVVQHLGSQFIGDASLQDPLANPTYADLAGLPPLFLTVGGHETLLDSVEQFADRAKNAGVEVALEVAEGQQHVYPFMAGRAPEADSTIADAGRWLRSRLGLS